MISLVLAATSSGEMEFANASKIALKN